MCCKHELHVLIDHVLVYTDHRALWERHSSGHRTSDRDMRQDCTNKEETPYEEKEKDIRGEKTGERDKKRSEMRQGEKRQ